MHLLGLGCTIRPASKWPCGGSGEGTLARLPRVHSRFSATNAYAVPSARADRSHHQTYLSNGTQNHHQLYLSNAKKTVTKHIPLTAHKTITKHISLSAHKTITKHTSLPAHKTITTQRPPDTQQYTLARGADEILIPTATLKPHASAQGGLCCTARTAKAGKATKAAKRAKAGSRQNTQSSQSNQNSQSC